MILPIAPIGVMLVSPVARAATIDSTNVNATATTPIHQEMPNSHWPNRTQAPPETRMPAANHEPGTSMRRSGSPAVCSVAADVRLPKARRIVRHRRAKAVRPEATIIAVAGHNVHELMPLRP